MNKNVIAPLALISVFATSTAAGAATDQEIEELRMQLAAVSERLEALAAENAELRRAQDQATSAIADVEANVSALDTSAGGMAKDAWPSRIKFDGYFRYRHEEIDAEGSSKHVLARVASSFDRLRMRYFFGFLFRLARLAIVGRGF